MQVRARPAIFTLTLIAAVAACDDRPTTTQPTAQPSTSVQAGVGTDDVIAQGTLPLPVNQTYNGSAAALRINQAGSGQSGAFYITNGSNSRIALLAQTAGRGPAFSAYTTGLSEAVRAEINNSNNSANALVAKTSGTGYAGFFQATSGLNGSPAIYAEHDGNGVGVQAYSAHSWAGFFYGYAGIGINATGGGAGLQVYNGSKNAVVPTSSGARALYSEEATEVFFTDYGFGKLVNGRAWVPLDATFSETVNLDQPYHVFVEEYGPTEMYVARRTFSGFEVVSRDGDPKAEFSYRIVAKRKGFELDRMARAPWFDHMPQRRQSRQQPTHY
jgi:hypothetical protein